MKEKSSFSGKLGFVMAAAASAVGLGNLWRFPYLAAKYGGGTFLFIYLVLAVTFGFTLMVTEIAIGRKTRTNVLQAYGKLDKRFAFLGGLAFFAPAIITPYYCVIGGWVVKYFWSFLTGQGAAMAQDSFFTGFIGEAGGPFICMLVFTAATALVVANGVESGIEKFSKVLMPILIILSIGLAIYVTTIPGAGAGIIYYLKPDFSRFSMKAVVAATGQLFYSLSLAMGIMITYGSYMKEDNNIESCARQIEVFDTLIAFLAGMIIVPAVYTFSHGDPNALSQGAGLMFVTLPKVFATIPLGNIIGIVFFLLVIFAALTSSVSLMEALVAVVIDRTGWRRKKSSLAVFLFILLLAVPSVFGYNIWSGVKVLGMQFLDLFDFISNSVMMPFVEFLTCIMVAYFIHTKTIETEIEESEVFKSRGMYRVMIKYIAPVLLLVILVSSVLNALGIISL